jgi:hypothetical protein
MGVIGRINFGDEIFGRYLLEDLLKINLNLFQHS